MRDIRVHRFIGITLLIICIILRGMFSENPSPLATIATVIGMALFIYGGIREMEHDKEIEAKKQFEKKICK